MDEWLLGKLVAGTLQDLGLDEGAAWWSVGLAKILISHQAWCEPGMSKRKRAFQALDSWLKDGEVQQFLQVNRYGGVLWYNGESFDQLLPWMLTIATVEISAGAKGAAEQVAQQIVACYDVVRTLQRAEQASEYQVVRLLEAVKG
jgi:hypothetical protein